MKRYLLFVGIALILVIAGGCSKGEEEKTNTVPEKDIICLHGVTIGNEPEGMDEFYKKLDELTIRDLGCIVRYDFIAWGEEEEKLNLAIASGEYDLLPAGTFSDYKTTAKKKAYTDLKEYLSLVPELVEHYTAEQPDALTMCEMDGKLYGIPQYSEIKVINYDEGFLYREDLRKEWGLQPVTDLSSMEAYLYRAKEAEEYKNQPIITDNRIWRCLWTMLAKGKYLEPVSSVNEIPYVVVLAEEPGKPLNRFETPEMLELLSYVKKWYEDGIIDPQILGVSNNEGERGKELMLADLKPCETNSPIWAVESYSIPLLNEAHPEWEFQYFIYGSNNTEYYLGSMAQNTVITITEKSKYKEQAIRFLEKIHVDEEYYLLLKYGIENQNYVIHDNRISFDGISTDYLFSGITGITDDRYDYVVSAANDQWVHDVSEPYEEVINQISKSATYSPLDTFVPDIAGLSGTLEKLREVYDGYTFPMLCGISENITEDLNRVNSKLYEAGLQKFMDALEEQLKEEG